MRRPPLCSESAGSQIWDFSNRSKRATPSLAASRAADGWLHIKLGRGLIMPRGIEHYTLTSANVGTSTSASGCGANMASIGSSGGSPPPARSPRNANAAGVPTANEILKGFTSKSLHPLTLS